MSRKSILVGRKRVRGPASLEEQAVVKQFVDYLNRCGMDERALELECLAFGDPADADCDSYGAKFLEGERPL